MWLLIVCVGAVKKRISGEKPILVKYWCIYTTLTQPLCLGQEQVTPAGLGLSVGGGDSPVVAVAPLCAESPGMAVPPPLAPGALRQQQILAAVPTCHWKCDCKLL